MWLTLYWPENECDKAALKIRLTYCLSESWWDMRWLQEKDLCSQAVNHGIRCDKNRIVQHFLLSFYASRRYNRLQSGKIGLSQTCCCHNIRYETWPISKGVAITHMLLTIKWYTVGGKRITHFLLVTISKRLICTISQCYLQTIYHITMVNINKDSAQAMVAHSLWSWWGVTEL